MNAYGTTHAPIGTPATETHWVRADRAFGRLHAYVLVRLYWPLSDPTPNEPCWP